MSAFISDGTLRDADRLVLRADELASEHHPPVDVERLAADLGLGLEFGHPSRIRGHVASLLQGVPDPIIALPRALADSTPLTPHERFSIAHEVAHWICQSAGVTQPTRKSEYWALEDLCNEMANRLLLPEASLDAYRVSFEAGSLRRSIGKLCLVGGVSAEPAARAIMRGSSAPVAAARLRIGTKRAKNAVGEVVWSYGNLTDFKLNPGHAVRHGDPLAPILEEARSRDIGEVFRIELHDRTNIEARRIGASGATVAASRSDSDPMPD